MKDRLEKAAAVKGECMREMQRMEEGGDESWQETVMRILGERKGWMREVEEEMARGWREGE